MQTKNFSRKICYFIFFDKSFFTVFFFHCLKYSFIYIFKIIETSFIFQSVKYLSLNDIKHILSWDLPRNWNEYNLNPLTRINWMTNLVPASVVGLIQTRIAELMKEKILMKCLTLFFSCEIFSSNLSVQTKCKGQFSGYALSFDITL